VETAELAVQSALEQTEAGARFGLSLARVIVVGVTGICVFAEMAGRVASVAGRPVFDLVRDRLGARVALANLFASFFVTPLTVAAETGGVALALELATGVNYLLWVPVVLVSVALSGGLILTTVDPIKLTEYTLVLSAAALPLTYLPVLVAANDRTSMGDKANSRPTNATASAFPVLLVVASLAAIPLMVLTKAGS
jgi:Mn2+/Fe2+ NRAMP family transporter